MSDERLAFRCEVAAWIVVAAGLLFVFLFHLVPALVAGLLVYALLHKTTRLLHGPRLSRGAAKVVAVGLLGFLAAGVTTGLVLLAVGFLRGHLGELPALVTKMADIVAELHTLLSKWGVRSELLDAARDPAGLRVAASEWLRTHGAELGHAGGRLGHAAIHALMGTVVGLLAFFHLPGEAPLPLARALSERLRRLLSAFESVVFAQVEISAVNTFLTGLYLLGVLPLLGVRLPFATTLVAVTFVAGLLPVVGNLVSNTATVLISLSVSPWVGLGSLTFLVVVHKLEYFLNARIVGSRIAAAAWEILLAIVVFEVAFGIPGVVLAPVLYAYVKGELRDRGLV